MALNNIRVLEIAKYAADAAAPYCGMILSDFGANVIKIDMPQSPNTDYMSRGKRSAVVDIYMKEGAAVVKKMCNKADVLLESLQPGTMEKLGLGPEVLTKENPKLIYARLTGYGQTGQLAQKSGTDINYTAMSGVLSKLGRQDQRPYAPLNIVAELGGGGLMCALGISMAIFERNKSGQGQVIDASMTEGAAYLGAWYDANKASFSKPRGLNLLDGGTAYYNTYVTKDFKFVAVGALESGCYENLLKGLNLMDKNLSQSGDQQQQKILFANVFLTKTRDEWAAIFNDLDACVTPVLTGEEAVRYPHNSVKGTFQVSSNLPIVIANAAPRLSRTMGNLDVRPLANKGQLTVNVLKQYGYSQDEINELLKKGAVRETNQK